MKLREKLDLTVIILTFNEELHIRRCIENVLPLASKVFVIDSMSSDKTIEIAKSLGAEVVQHKWPGNQAAQFNWALDNINIDTEWIFRIDADEYLSQELIDEIRVKLPLEPASVNGVIMGRKVFFLNKLMKHGATVFLLRIFRNGYGRSENRVMDEHIILTEGDTAVYKKGLFYDNNLSGIERWTNKHLDYAKRNAAEFLNIKYALRGTESNNLVGQASLKRKLKKVYMYFPLFVRPVLYFIFRYFIQLSFLDGKEGFLWCFYQGWWSMTMVDTRIYEIEKACGKDKNKIKDYLSNNFGINFS